MISHANHVIQRAKRANNTTWVKTGVESRLLRLLRFPFVVGENSSPEICKSRARGKIFSSLRSDSLQGIQLELVKFCRPRVILSRARRRIMSGGRQIKGVRKNGSKWSWAGLVFFYVFLLNASMYWVVGKKSFGASSNVLSHEWTMQKRFDFQCRDRGLNEKCY